MATRCSLCRQPWDAAHERARGHGYPAFREEEAPRWILHWWPPAIGHTNFGHVSINNAAWDYGWSLEMGFGVHEKQEPGLIRWRWWRSYRQPIMLVRRALRQPHPANPPEIIVSTAWTGRRWEIRGVAVCGRVWCWA